MSWSNNFLSVEIILKFIIIFLSVIIFLIPVSSFAIQISEIMYDAPGTDTGFEWIEVFNSGTSTVDLSQYKLRESNVSHAISAIGSTSSQLVPGAYAVIVDVKDKFDTNHPATTGVIVDSAFSLSNEGEMIGLISSSGVVEHVVQYDPSIGGSGDGSTLNFFEGKWHARKASPGEAASSEVIDSSENTSSSTSSSNSSKTVYAKPYIPPARQIFPLNFSLIDANGYAGYPVSIELVKTGNEPFGILEYEWNFGDGAQFNSTSLKLRHMYKVPGEHTLTVNIKGTKGYRNSLSQKVIIEPISVQLKGRVFSNGKYAIDIVNYGTFPLNIGEWLLQTNAEKISVPYSTNIQSSSYIRIPLKRILSPTSEMFLYDSKKKLISSSKGIDYENVNNESVEISNQSNFTTDNEIIENSNQEKKGITWKGVTLFDEDQEMLKLEAELQKSSTAQQSKPATSDSAAKSQKIDMSTYSKLPDIPESNEPFSLFGGTTGMILIGALFIVVSLGVMTQHEIRATKRELKEKYELQKDLGENRKQYNDVSSGSDGW